MNKRTYKLMNWAKIEEIVYSESDNPHEILGAHVTGSSVLVQTFQPGAKSVRLQLLDGDKSYRMEEADEEGYFALLLPGKAVPAYEYVVEAENGSLRKMRDAYNFAPQITKEDTEKFDAGIHYSIYEKLGRIRRSWMESRAFPLRFGRRTLCGSAWWVISTAGTAGFTRCADFGTPAFLRFLFPM